MLLEIRSDQLISCGKPRPPIVFHTGLNTVLGSEDGSNSIGKSTFLMIVDFVFGGDDYVLKSTDVQTQVGPHTIQFIFEFHGEKHFFSRNTSNYAFVNRCDGNFQPIEEIPIKDYRAMLFDFYGIALPSISFRDVVGRYFRVYGRNNLDERQPLHSDKKERASDTIISLMKLFNKYSVIFEQETAVKQKSAEKLAYKKAQDFHIVPKITKKQLAANEKRMMELQDELIKLQENSGKQLIGLDSEQVEIIAEWKQKLTAARRQKGRLLSQLNALKNDMMFERPTIKSDFQELIRFFPGVNIKKIEDIERFHHQLVSILNSEFEEAKQRLLTTISLANAEIASIEQEIQALGITPKVSRTVLEEYSTKKSEIDRLEKENETYKKMESLRAEAKRLTDCLHALQKEHTSCLKNEINKKMDEINNTVYSKEKKPPVLTINKPGSYTFLTPDDSGTGTSYKGLVVYDLSILQLTVLPALIHDSVILKQIADEPLEKIIELYNQSTKQVFISLDKKGSYTEQTQKILEQSKVLQLSDNGNELFGRSWNKK